MHVCFQYQLELEFDKHGYFLHGPHVSNHLQFNSCSMNSGIFLLGVELDVNLCV